PVAASNREAWPWRFVDPSLLTWRAKYPTARCRPSGDQATDWTPDPPSYATFTADSSPVATSHRRTAPTRPSRPPEAVASVFPSGEKATATTSPSIPDRVWVLAVGK